MPTISTLIEEPVPVRRIPLPQDAALKRLTALWALSESGLGGIMFALKIPFTGFFIGAIAVIILGLIAKFTNNDSRKMLGATVIVLVVKATVSPHSPLPAYLAVSFQGLMAALLFRIVASHKPACIILGMITMLESAMQKIIVLTLIFGKTLWDALNSFFEDLSKTFSVHAHHNYAGTLLFIYLLIYACWGAVIGIWAATLFGTIENRKEVVLAEFENFQDNSSAETPAIKRPHSRKRLILFFGILIFITGVFFLSGARSMQLLWIILRSVAAVLLLFVVLRPIIQFAVARWLQSRSAAQQKDAAEIMLLLPLMRSYVKSAYQMTRKIPGSLARMRSFALYVIILSLYAD